MIGTENEDLGGSVEQARRRSLTVRALGTVAAVLAAGLWAAPTAQAHQDYYAWGPCNQRTKLFGSDLTVTAATTNPLPGDGQGDGVLNSHRERLREAVAEWNSQGINGPYGGGVTRDIVYLGNGNSGNVLVDHRDVGGALGITVLPARCLNDVHSTSRQQLPTQVRITIDNREDWFSQGGSDRRSLWEACLKNNRQPAYTCSKTQDVGQVMVHELGHALGIVDIEAHLVPHLNGDRTPLNGDWANCFSATDYASMCNFPQYRSAGRTLHPYDKVTLQRTIS